jgi:hypothetical protein
LVNIVLPCPCEHCYGGLAGCYCCLQRILHGRLPTSRLAGPD